jgi:hypothetical protein
MQEFFSALLTQFMNKATSTPPGANPFDAVALSSTPPVAGPSRFEGSLSTPWSPRTPSRTPRSVRGVERSPPPRPLSPGPSYGYELRAFLTDFAFNEGIDLTGHEGVLLDNDFQPDILVNISAERLSRLLGITEGHAHRMLMYLAPWNARLALKRRSVPRSD